MKNLNFNDSKFGFAGRKMFISGLLKEFDFLSSGVIGQSLCGRSIDFLRLGSKKNSNLWVSAHHGMEWLTSWVVLRFLREVCEKIKNNESFCGINLASCLAEKGLTVIPCLNPDGAEISLFGFAAAGRFSGFVRSAVGSGKAFWQANARGVDLNHNYDAGWKELRALEEKNGINRPCSTRFGGVRPHSEPETFALTSFCRKNNFSSAIAFHSQGEEIYWDYGDRAPKSAEKMANILALASGYEVSRPEGLAVGGGFKDWFTKEFKRPALTIEIGKGKNPLPALDLPSVYGKIEKMLYIAMLM